MTATQRREQIYARIIGAKSPVSATMLAKEFCVSRQIIVGDIAILRASGYAITATPKGYQLAEATHEGLIKVFVCNHLPEQTEAELGAILYHGGEVLDVIVSHPVYGEISAPLNLKTQYDIAAFLQKVKNEEASLLSDLTGGLHLHSVRCADEATYERIYNDLDTLGVLYKGEE